MKRRAFWAIVLAGGDGSRLAETSRRMHGSCLPKQFLSLGRSRTFLQATLDRLGSLVPAERTVVVVAARHEALAREQLADFPGVELVAQPSNLGFWWVSLPITPSNATRGSRGKPSSCCKESYAPKVGTGLTTKTLRALYERLSAADFSRDLVAGASQLWVTPMLDSGWSDCGTPERLAALGDLSRLSGIFTPGVLDGPESVSARPG